MLSSTYTHAILCDLFADWQVANYRRYLANIAMKGPSTDFAELLPPSAFANLNYLYQLDWVRAILPHKEIAANLDQCPKFQEHAGTWMPVILASISHM